MATRETRLQRGRRRGQELVRTVVGELRMERQTANVSQRAIAKEIGWQQSEVNRLERFGLPNVPLVRLAEIASVLGLEVSIRLHRIGDPVRDRASQALIARFVGLVASAYRVTHEALLPTGDQRSWDLLLRCGSVLIGVEAVTRVRDLQALVRHIRLRERDGGVGHVVLLLSDSGHNRAMLSQLVETLGPRFTTSRREFIAALRAGRPIPGSGVMLL